MFLRGKTVDHLTSYLAPLLVVIITLTVGILLSVLGFGLLGDCGAVAGLLKFIGGILCGFSVYLFLDSYLR